MAPAPTRPTRRRTRKTGGLAEEASLPAALRQVVDDLGSLKVHFALVGGLAVSALTSPRMTRDIDLAVAAAEDSEAEAVIHALGYPVEGTVEQTRTHRLATARLRGPQGVLVDLLFASSGVEAEVVQKARRLEVLPGMALPVAQLGHLLALKVLARDDRRRPQDWDDLRALLGQSDAKQRALAQATLEAIAARGFGRGRNLRAAWKKALADCAPRRTTATSGTGRGRRSTR